jgi:hypothetical protein
MASKAVEQIFSKLDRDGNGYVKWTEFARFLQKYDTNKDGILETKARARDRNNIERARRALGMNLFYFLRNKNEPMGFHGCIINGELAHEIVRKGLYEALGHKPTKSEKAQGLSVEQLEKLVAASYSPHKSRGSQLAEADADTDNKVSGTDSTE